MAPTLNAPGDASFNAADRLAIINLFGNYAQLYDAGNLEEFKSLFTDNVDIKLMERDKVVAEGLDQVTQVITEYVCLGVWL